MTAATQEYATQGRNPGWLRRSEAWLDQRGKFAWIVAMVLGFILFWPIGLSILGYMIWSNRMFGTACRKNRQFTRQTARYSHGFSAMRSSGNAAFDAYKEDTLRRLEDEQKNFEEFLQRLRDARDKAEFDQFMNDRADKARNVREDAAQDA
ncbi:hypothetical protein AL036_07515 [Salipiger aestuarii]|uniref:Uncharacterized protein DUF2852 n=1 Tax=Salipiger aestuarii TaxID=568098 RepID=A0A327YAJ1_9RHOB|nr:DUF2852 domain-containing protein [Salipiger aestuarii]EIE51874.1 hypothetical protein C357_06349 [Citreicella sp. 357]KAA8608312.1 hypothetical protein AL036_07515 [Salipiger aestuarii]KAA8612869.1 hypothetical protein AL037_07030 [Salipiger aestuarii]KAB2542221.1 hypothetical protein AL035_08400 [Salipiger aestuarii]RAK16805.1 uncharacterized protein DUF2852 [Salipiger aestuarii]